MAIWVYIRLWYSPSTVFSLSVAGPAVFHPRSEDFPSRVRSFSLDRGRFSAICAFWRRRSSTKLQTGDGTVLDRGRKPYGPGTVRCWTGDGKPTDLGRYDGGPETETLRTEDAKVTERGRSHPRPGTVFGNLCLLTSQVPDKTTDLGRKPRRPGTQLSRTRDAAMTDRGRNSHGPGTVRWWTGDGKPTD